MICTKYFVANAENLEDLFQVEGTPIMQDSIHAIGIGPSLMRMMAIGYDEQTHQSIWVGPGVHQPLGITLDSRLLEYQQASKEGKSYLVLRGGKMRVRDVPYDSLTGEQKRIHDNWDDETEKAGFGGDRLWDQ